MKKKLLVLILALLMVASMLPLSASAITGTEEIDIGGGWYWPLPANCKTITQGFGRKESGGKLHQGIDIGANTGTEIRAARPGVVYAVGSHSSMGNFVCIRHGKSGGKYIYTTYMHMLRTATKTGAVVDQNTVIGYVGATGEGVTGPHLHFHIFRANSANSSSYSPNRTNQSALANNYIDPSPSKIQYGSGGGSTPPAPSVPVGTTSKPNVSVNGRTANISWTYSGSGTSFDVYVIQSPWDWSGIKYKQNVTGNSCTFWDMEPGYYNVFTVAQPNNRQVQSEWAELIVQEAHTTHSKGSFRYTATEHPHYNYYSCSVCGQDFTDGSTTPDNTCRQCHWEHVWDAGQITQGPAANQPGIRTFTCTICGETKTETIPPTSVSGSCGASAYWELADGVLTISGSGDTDNYTTSDSEENRKDPPWKDYEDSIYHVIVREGIQSIGDAAFDGYDNLIDVSLPNTVTRIGDGAFRRCDNVTHINIPTSVTSIGNTAFYGDEKLTYVGDIPKGVSTIRNQAFGHCESLTSISIPKSVTRIYFSAFEYCYGLKDIYYGGTEAQWNSIESIWGEFRDHLNNVQIHFTNEPDPTPTPEPTPIPTPEPTPDPTPIPTSTPTATPAPTYDPTPEPEPPTVTFNDVPADAYYADAVSWAVANGVTSGVGPGQFGPDMRCTRAQMVTFLWKAQGQPEPKSTENPFVDVKPSDYCYKAVLWAVENSISGGTDSTHFSPSQSCDRAQAVTFIWRTEGRPEAETRSSFSDVSRKSYYADAIDWAVEYKIVNGVGNGKYDPKGVCSRAQIVTMLYRDMK